MTFNDKIDLFMKDNGYNDLKKLAKDCDIPYTTLRDFYLKKSADNSRLSTIRKLASFMNCTMDYLTYDDLIIPSQIKLENLHFDNAEKIDLPSDNVKIPVLGRIPAGMPFEAIEDEYTTDYEEIPKAWLRGGNEFFALKLDGDSMEPEYQDKDVVIFRKAPDCESGQDCCIRINGYDATFKRVKKQLNGIMVIPLNENNSTGFTTTFYTNEEILNMPVEILGVVKQIRRNR